MVRLAPSPCPMPMRRSQTTTGWSSAVRSSAIVMAMIMEDTGARASPIVFRAKPARTTMALSAPTTHSPKGIASPRRRVTEVWESWAMP